MTAALRRHLAFALLLALYLALASLYSVATPLFESPDEVWHYEYVRWLVEGRGLPRPEQVGEAPWHQEGSQPPLYYLAAAALTAPISTANAAEVIRYNPHAAIGQAEAFGNKNMVAHGEADSWPWRGVALAAHVARFFSVLLGAVTVTSAYLLALAVFPDRLPVALLAAALVAFNPQFLFLSGTVNNDNLVTAACSFGLYWLVMLMGRRDAAGAPAAPTWGQLVILGLVVGVAALSKLSGLFLAPLAALGLTWLAWRRRSLRAWLLWGVVTVAAAALVAGWWYVRNLLLYGDPLGLEAMFAILPRRAEPPTPTELLVRAQSVWRSYWAVFGWFNVVAAEWVYVFFSALALAGLAGLLLAAPLAARRRPPGVGVNPVLPWQLLLLVVWLAAMVALLWRWATMRYPQGRLLFPAATALAVLLAWGLLSWLPRRAQAAGAVVVAATLVGVAGLAPLRWIAPAYAAPPAAPAPLSAPVEFGGLLALRGAALSADELRVGDTLTVDLAWEALAPIPADYSVFIHLTDENEILQAQRDSWPGAGALPTRGWTPGAPHVDRYALAIPATAPAPARLRVDVGVYNYAGGTRLPVNGGNFLTLGYVTLLPAAGAGDLPHSTFIDFGGELALVGYEFDNRVVAPGGRFYLTLWWEALAPPQADYKTFVHVVAPPESVWGQKDQAPLDDTATTSSWTPGERFEDPTSVYIPAETPPGVYFVEIGVYDPHTNDRLKVDFSDRGVVLGQIRIAAPEDVAAEENGTQ